MKFFTPLVLFFKVLILTCTLSVTSFAQSMSNYQFSTNTSSSLYRTMGSLIDDIDMTTGTTVLIGGSQNNSTSAMQSIGFDFWIMGVRQTQFNVTSNGWVGIGTMAAASYGFGSPWAGVRLAPMLGVAGPSGGIGTSSIGRVHYKVVGSQTNRVLVVEFLRMAINTTVVNDTNTFQVRLYESTGTIEYVYGRMIATLTLPKNYNVGFQFSPTLYNNLDVTTNTISTSSTTPFSVGVSGPIANIHTPTAGNNRAYVWTPDPPDDPGVITINNITSSSMRLNWINPSNESGFALYRSTNGGLTYQYEITLPPNLTTYTVTGLTSSTQYSWRLFSYRESISAPADGVATTLPANKIYTINSGNWNDPSIWNTSTVPTSQDSAEVSVGHSVIFNAATGACGTLLVKGTLAYWTSNANQYFVVNGDVIVYPTGNFNAGSGTGPAANPFYLYIGGSALTSTAAGNLIVDGTFDMQTTASVQVLFYGTQNATVTGSGATCDIPFIYVNKGSLNNQIEFLRTFTQPSSLSSYTSVQRMIVNSGTMKLSAPIVVNSFHTSMVYFVNNNNSRFWLNHTGINLSPVPLVTGIATLGLFGELRIDAGKINLGTGANSNYITTNGVLKLNGGECNLKGNFTIFGIASAQLLVYGGKLSIDPQGLNNLSNNVSIFSVNTSSTFEFTDGLIEIVNPHSTAPLTSTIASINIQSGGYRNISGGAFAIGDGVSIKSGGVLSSSCGFNIISAVPLHKLIIRNNYSSSNSRYCRISSNLIIEDSLILETGSYLQTGSAGVGRKVIVEGHIKNNGIISAVYPTSTGPGVGSIELEGTSPRVVSGAGTASWLSLRVANTGGVTFSNTGTWELERIVMEKGNVTNALSAISIGSALYRANITIGGLDETTTAGTFSNLPTIISVAGNPNYIYGPAANSMQTGSFNEISAGAATLNCLTINDAQGLVSNRNINIEDSLNLIKGVLNIGNNSLVLGTSVSSTGRLTRTSGFVQLGNNGSFTRWYASGARPQFEYSTGFPLSIGSRDRSVLFSLNTGIATGGSIMVTHNNIVGYTDITPAFSDGGITINRRVNSFWKLSSPTAVNIGAGRILTLRLIGEGTGSVLDPTKLQVVKSNSIAMGTAVASGGTNIVPYVNRDFTQAQIALGGLYDTLYIGANSSVNPLLPNIIAINTGNWNVPSTWEGNVIPTMSNSATIDNGVVVTIPTGYTATCNGLNIVAGGELAAVSGSLNNAARLTIDGTLNVSGSTINVTASTGHGILINSGGLLTSSGGIVNIGPSGGGDRELLVQGTLTVTGGNININGNLNIASTGTLNQSGGNINVDGNSGTASTSLAAGTHMVSINSNNLNCSNGSINIIDPPHSSVLPGTMMALRITAPSSLTAFTADHSFVFGNGTSTEVGNSNGFVIDVRRSGLVPIQNVIVNAGNANGRWVSTSYTNGTYGTYIKGNLTINSGSEFRHTNTSTFVVGKNLINNGTLTVSAPMVFGGNGYYVINNAQTISGTGVFRNSVSSPTASFGSATVDNGVSLSLGSSNKTFSFSGVLNIGSIKVYTGNNTLAFTNSGTLSRTTGYVVGNLSKYFAVGSSVSKTYEIGDTNNYLPVTVTYPSVTTAGNVIVSTVNGDHSLLSSSCFDLNKTINRYWNITNSGTVNTGGNYTFSFNASDVDFGTNLSSSKLFVYSPSSWKAGLSGTSSPTTFSVNGLTEYGDVAIGEIIPATASITISVSDTAVCSGTSLTFNSSITNGGDAPTYQWKVNGTNVGTGSSYSSFSLNNGDTVTCTLTSNNACVSSPIVVSNSIVTKIYQPSVGGTISGDTAICSGNSPSALTLSGNTGSVVRWESSVSPFLVYSPIINTTTTLNPGTLTQTTKYRAVVQNGVCSSVNSAIHTINVNPTPVAGTITGTNAVCSGNSPGVLTLGGTTGTIQKWQSKTTGSWVDIVNTLSTYNPGALSTTTSYRAVVTSGSCVADTSAAFTVTVTPSSVGGTVSADQTICSGGTVTALTLSGQTGTVEKWQSANNVSFTGATDIPLTAGLTSYTPTGVVTTTFYRAVVKSGSCASANSSSAKITVDPSPVAGTITGTNAVCSGNSPGVLTLGGTTGTIQKWQSKTTGSWVDISNTSSTYNPGALSTTTSYRAVVTSGSCVADTSAAFTVTVNPAAVGGTLSSNQTICSGGLVSTLNLTGHTGTIVKWQSKTTGSWSDIANTTSSYTPTGLTQTTSYRVVVNSVGCGSDTSTIVVITVNPSAVAGTITGTNAVCSGNSPGVLTLGGTTGTIVKWQSKTTGSWVDISNTSSTYNPGALSTTTSYRAVVTSGSCGNDTSAAFTVTVNPAAVGGSVSSNQTICSGGSVSTLNLTGHVGTVTKWQSATNVSFTGATDISGTAGLTSYTPSGVLTTTYFRAVVSSPGCGTANSTPVLITVDPAAIGGTLTGTSPICSGSTTNLFLSGYTGTIVKWQQSTNAPLFNIWTDITNTSTSYSTPALTQTTRYRAVVSGGSCPAVNSSEFEIVVSGSGIWLGVINSNWNTSANWCGGVPTATTNVRIPSGTLNAPLINISNAVVKSLTIDSGATLGFSGTTNNIDIKEDLIVNGTFNTANGTVTYSGTGSQNVAGITYANLKINGTGNKTLTGNASVSGTLDLSLGHLVLGNNNLSVTTISSGSATSYVVTNGTGNLKIANVGLTAKSFPVGTSSSYTPLSISNTGVADEISVKVLQNVYPSYVGETGVGIPISSNIVNKTFIINEAVSGGSLLNITFQWNASDESSMNRAQTIIGRYSGGVWNSVSGVPSGASGSNPYTFTLSSVSTMGIYGIGDVNSPLPVKLLSFNAKLNKGLSHVSWVTASEMNTMNYEVERSLDGVTFESIATVSAKGSSGSRHDYLFVDEQSADLLKRTSIIFYRLKQNSFNGDYEYSGVASVNEYGKAIFEIFSASPNPFRNQANVLFKTSSDAPILVEIVDAFGKLVKAETINPTIGANTYSFELGLDAAPGIYFVKIKQDNNSRVVKFIKE